MEYFRARQVYQKLFEGMRKKYAGLGRLGGTVTLTGLTREERQQLGGFFQKDYTENKTVTISGRLMEKALSSSRFAGISWEEILEAYFGQPLEVTKEQKETFWKKDRKTGENAGWKAPSENTEEGILCFCSSTEKIRKD